MVLKLAQWLDRKEFLYYRLWEFSLRNLLRLFTHHFLLRVLLLHPVKALRGVSKYQKLVKNSSGKILTGTKKLKEILHTLKTDKTDLSHLIIAPGFCMKPYDENKGLSTCPVEHFNHRCLVLEKPSMLLKNQYLII